MSRTSTSFFLLALFVLAVLLSSPRLDAGLPTGEFDEHVALEKAARSLFPTSAPAGLTVTRVADVELFGQGYRYDTFSVNDPSGKPAGRFVRCRAYDDAASQVDLALKVEDGRITACEPLRPVILAGQPFPGLPVLLSRLSRRRLADSASGLAAVIRGLALVEPAMAGPRPTPLASPGAQPLVVARQPSLAIGDRLPAFTATALSGDAIGSRELAGKPLVIVYATLSEPRSRALLSAAARVVPRHARVRLLVVLDDPAGAARVHGWNLKGRQVVLPAAVLDQDRAVRAALKVPIVPYILVFDHSGRLARKGYWKGEASLEADVAAVATPEGAER